jgi:hypothetical protein
MPISFKPLKNITIVRRTPTASLVLCDVCGGLNAMASTAVKVDCTGCGTTGYSNFYSDIYAQASYRPGSVKRWDSVAGQLSYLGECSIKLDSRYKRILEAAEYIKMDGIDWKFSILREPGEAMGQARLVLSLSRK